MSASNESAVPERARAPALGGDRPYTFLFTDIESSTRIWEGHPEAMRIALARHDSLLRQVVSDFGGTVFKAVGDGICAAFPAALPAVEAAVAAQRSLAAAQWPAPVELRVRMAIHAGEVERRDDDYFGRALNRVARLLEAAHGGQALASRAVHDLVSGKLAPPVGLKLLGAHRLRDLAEPETIFQITHPELDAEFPPLRTLETLSHNLPVQLTRFVGREREVREIVGSLGSQRLLTVTGTGGCGKTRICLQAAADALPSFAGGAWMVELAAVADGTLVPAAMAAAMGVREEPGCTITESLVRAIRSRRMLVLLDNCEHLLPDVCALATTLLARCPELRILATSREALGVSGEMTIRIPSLSLPPAEPIDPEALGRFESVQLFLDRVRLFRHDFRLSAGNAPAVASICRRLDGIPLAIELAAARVRALSAEEVDRRLDDRFRLLTGGSRIALPRHRTLRALIDWSYDLLAAPEKAVLQRVSVFTNGWTLEAAERVCGDATDGPGADARIAPTDVLDLLTVLVDRSLVVAAEHDGHTRYRLLETVRQYARDRLLEAGDAGTVWRRFSGWFRDLAEHTSATIIGAGQARAIAVLAADADNLRAALNWCRDQDPDTLVAIATNLSVFWYVTGALSDGRHWVGDAIRLCEGRSDLTLARLLIGASVLARDQGDLGQAEALAARCLALCRELPSPSGEARALHTLALIASDRGQIEHAEALYRESMAIWQRMGDRSGIATALLGLALAAEQADRFGEAESLATESIAIFRELHDTWGTATSLNVLGVACCERGDYDAATAAHEESLSLQRRLGNRRGIALSLGNLGQIAFRRGELGRAQKLYRDSAAIFDELCDRWGTANVLAWSGLLAAEQGDPGRALALLMSSRDLARATGIPPPIGERALEDALARARDALAQSGRAVPPTDMPPMSVESAIASVLEA